MLSGGGKGFTTCLALGGIESKLSQFQHYTGLH
jgi:hypothetical protein